MVVVDGRAILTTATVWWFWWWRSKNRILHQRDPPSIKLFWLTTIYTHPRMATKPQRRQMTARWGPKCAVRWTIKPWQCRCKGPIQAGHRRAWYLHGPTRVSNLMPICDAHNKHMGTLAPRTYVTGPAAWRLGWIFYFLRWLGSKTITVATVGVMIAVAWVVTYR